MTRLEDFCRYLTSRIFAWRMAHPNITLCGADVLEFISDYEKQEHVAITIVKDPTD